MIGWLSPVVALLALVAIVCLVALTIPLVRLSVLTLRALRHRKILMKPTEKWWPEFERQFRAYAEEAEKRKRSRPV